MRRREFITLLGGAAAWPLATRAQESGRIYRLAVLTPNSRSAPQLFAFFDELRQLGFVEGQNLTVLPGGFDIAGERLSERATAIVKASPDVILAAGELATRAAQAATKTVPIVGAAEDMVSAGLVSSLAHPGGNTTGISMLSPELDGKRQDILIEAVPGVRRMGALADSSQFNANTPRNLQALQDAAKTKGVELSVFSVDKPEKIVGVIAEAKTWGAAALNVLASPMLTTHRRIVFEGVSAARLPAIYQWPESAETGGLAAYGPRIIELYRQRARMLVKVLRGAKPADMPVEQPTRFELVINLRTARAIGHEVPAGLVLRADKVIE
jgi:putative ABC transport system substrate-binding protein